ncbi:MAG: hypothetical protein KBG15_13845, partial [Kofleriaceae bacterium]|nr:hypothetical protein [Kofleriaceae bacterium]
HVDVEQQPREYAQNPGRPPEPLELPDRVLVGQPSAVVVGIEGAQQLGIIRRWGDTEITVQIPATAQLGDSAITLFRNQTKIASLPLVIVDPKDQRFHAAEAVALDPMDKEYIKSVLADLRATANKDHVKELDDFVVKVEKMLEMAERGELTKAQMLEQLQKAQEQLQAAPEANPEDINKQLAETGKQLQKSEITQALGEALAKNDLEKAKQELEKLADKMEKQELTPAQQQKLAEQLKDVAKQFEQKQAQKQQQDQKQQQQQQEKMQDEIRKLEKDRAKAKTPEQQAETDRRLEKKKDELKKLQKEQQEKQDSEQQSALKRLHRDMGKTAEQLEKKPNQSEQEQKEQQQQASRNMKDAARETGRVDQEQRKQASQKKVASQMEDLKEAMRRAKQKGNKGPKDPFNKQGKQQDFAKRAQGQKGSGQAWKPGQGKPGQGQAQGQGKQGQGKPGQGGPGDQPGGDGYGVGHDDNLTGDATGKSGDTKDQDLQGVSGKGPSRRETILAAAQKGFASRGYQDVYANYKRIVEEVMRTEKVPSSYKYYVKRYFTQIHPSGRVEQAPATPAPAPGAN